MIQIYKIGNENYQRNGDAALQVISCELDMTLNGAWELTLVAPIDPEGKWKHIQMGAVIAAPTPISDKQLFRVYDLDTDIDAATALARPVFMDSANDVFFVDTRPTNCTGQAALDWLMRGSRYSGTSDITDVRTAYYTRKNLIEALASDEDNSFINRWGGEIVYDNFTVHINRRQGKDRGLRVEFGRNIESIHESQNCESLATRIYPVAFNGRMLNAKDPYIDSPRIGSYPIVYTRVLTCEDIKLREDLEGDPSDGDIVCETLEELNEALYARCQEQYDAGIDLPKITYDVDMVDLSSKAEYADYKALEYVVLGDTVHCRHRKLGIEADARVIQVVYDCARKANTRIVLGDYQHDYFSRLNDTARRVDTLNKKIDTNTVLLGDAIADASRELNEKIANASGMYCSEEVQPDGSIIYLLHDKPALKDSRNVIKLTSEAIGFSTDGGKTYPYGFTVTGEMVAALLTANGVNANWIRLGVLQSKDGKTFYLDLDKGILKMKATEFTISGKTVGEIADAAVDALDGTLDQAGVFNRLTNNGKLQGLFMLNDQLYINATYLTTGILQSKDGKTFKLDLDKGTLEMQATSLLINGDTVKDLAYAEAAQVLLNFDMALNQESVFNRLTNGGKNQGIFLEDGRLYINAEFIRTGVIDLTRLRVEGNLGGIAEGTGNDGERDTRGIVIYGPAGLDTYGNALAPYIIMTDSGFRVQLSDRINFYLTSNFVINAGLLVNGSARITGRLDVEGNLVVKGYIEAYDEIQTRSSLWIGKDTGSTSPSINVFTSGSDGIAICGYNRNSSKVWVGTSNCDLVLHCTNLQSDAQLVVTSDRNAKKDIEPLENDRGPNGERPPAASPAAVEMPSTEEAAPSAISLADAYLRLLDHMTPVRFRYKTESDDAPYHLGYIAQDVEEALSKAGLSRQDLAALSYGIDDTGKASFGIAYGELIALLHLQVKKQNEEIQALKADIAALKAAIA